MAISFQIIDVRANQFAMSLEKVKADKESGAILIGIEVTESCFADIMDYNIDPQHSDENGDSKMSAIKWINENGLEFCSQFCEDDSQNITLYTVRADLDSVGAMVILVDYIRNYYYYKVSGLTPTFVGNRFVEIIHQADCFIGKGEWKPNMLGKGYNDSLLAPVAKMVQDFKLPLEKRVELIGEWLITGKFEGISAYENAVEKERSEIITALESGETKVLYFGQWFDDVDHYSRYDLHTKEFDYCEDECFSSVGLIVVESRLRAATSIGYDKCPVVIAYNPEMPHRNGEGTYRKFTICQFNEGWVDLPAVTKELNQLEEGWGGSPVIIGSPQERDSNLELIQVAEIVAKHLK